MTFTKLLRLSTIQSLIRRLSTKSNKVTKSDIQQIDDSIVEREFAAIDVNQFASMATDERTRTAIQAILTEYEYQKYVTQRVPTCLSEDNMRQLLSAVSAGERKGVMARLYRIEMTKLKTRLLRTKISKEIAESLEHKWVKVKGEPKHGLFDSDGELLYGLWRNTLFTRILPTHVRRLAANRLRVAALHDQKVVIDLDYDQHMRSSDRHLLVKQIKFMYKTNKHSDREPFDIHFTNCDAGGQTMAMIDKQLPHSRSPSFGAQFHRQSYLDLFPKSRLVYLTHFGDKPLHDYNSDDIVVIAGLYGPNGLQPIDISKARREGIRTMRLPLEEHIVFKSGGSPRMSLCRTLAVLRDVRDGVDWKTTLKENYPKEYQKDFEEIVEEDAYRRDIIKRRLDRAVKYAHIRRYKYEKVSE